MVCLVAHLHLHVLHSAMNQYAYVCAKHFAAKANKVTDVRSWVIATDKVS